MDNNSVDDPGRDLDLNQEPIDTALGSVFGLGPFLDDLDAAQDTEYRIRYLAFLTARARHRQRLRELRNSVETESSPVEPAAQVNGDGGLPVSETSGVVEGSNMDRGKGCKRDSSHLVAKALEMDSEVKINVKSDGGGSFYDCNLCLYIAREPILTCCGHLFCWACFYKLPYVDSTTKECPACNGEVTDSTIVPIYGNGDSSQDSKSESSMMMIPPRPRAQRIESVRQQRVMRGGFQIPVTEVLRRIRTTIGTIGEETEPEPAAGSADVHSGATGSQEPPSGEVAVVREQRRPRTRQFSRVLSESAASLSSISAALDSAERLVEDLKTFINLRRLQRSSAQVLSPIDEDSMTRNAGTSQAEQQPSPAETNLAAGPSSSRTTHVSDSVGQMENPDVIYLGESSAQAPTTTSSRRRTRSSSRLANMENNNAPQETRRRRRR